MPTPISNNDRRLREAASAEHIQADEAHLSLEGLDYKETKRAQADAMLPGGRDAASAEAVGHLVDHAVKKVAGSLGLATAGEAVTAVASPVISVIAAHVEALQRGDEEGAELNAALRRDTIQLAAIYVGQDALPMDYIHHMEAKLSESHTQAGKVVGNLMQKHGAKAWAQMKQDTAGLIRQGQDRAAKLHIDSTQSLAAAIAKSPAFAAAYHQSVAFRVGIDAAIWSAQSAKH